MENNDGLNGLSYPKRAISELDITHQNSLELKEHLNRMVYIRMAERCMAAGKKEGLIGGPVHLGVGQEAVAVGVAACLRSTDRIFGAHRSHAHLLSLSRNAHALFAEVLGKATGFSKGMGGSMHLWSQLDGFYGSVPIVAATVPLAVGAGLAAKLQHKNDVAIAYFGDGAMEEGIIHESLNLAKIQDIPVIFVAENNLFASHMHISMRQPNMSMSRFATANEIPFKLVDGNDIIAVADAANELVLAAREGRGPGFLELVTYRWYGHVDWREDIDVGVNRSKEDLEDWKKLDPILRLQRALIAAKHWSEDQQQEMESAISLEIKAAWQQALEDPYPDESQLLAHVYQKEGTK